MYVCLFNVITDRDFRALVADENCTISAVHRSLGTKPRCGKCVPYLRQLLRQVVEMPPQPILPILREGISHCESVRDGTRDLFSKVLEAQEDHVDFTKTQRDLIPKIGIEILSAAVRRHRVVSAVSAQGVTATERRRSDCAALQAG